MGFLAAHVMLFLGFDILVIPRRDTAVNILGCPRDVQHPEDSVLSEKFSLYGVGCSCT